MGGGREALVNIRVIVLEGEARRGCGSAGEGAEVDEEVSSLGGWTGFPLGVAGDGRNDAVDVRVVLHLAAPGVKHAGEASASAPVLVAMTSRRAPALSRGGVVEDLGMGQAEGAQFGGQGEGDHEVGHGQEAWLPAWRSRSADRARRTGGRSGGCNCGRRSGAWRSPSQR